MAKEKDLPEVSIDMTPMIDVVFNLIIFFMLVNQMVQLERAEIELPLADQAQEEQIEDKGRLIINVHKNGRIEVGGRTVSWKELVKIIFEEASISRERDNSSSRYVLIRADVETPYKIIQKILVECARQKIYKISFGAKIPD